MGRLGLEHQAVLLVFREISIWFDAGPASSASASWDCQQGYRGEVNLLLLTTTKDQDR